MWKLCATVIILNMVIGVVIKSYFSAMGYSFASGGSAAAGDGVATLMDAVDENDVSCNRTA